MVTHISKSPEETRRLGAKLGAEATPGLVIGLVGDLGSGKTQFVKGFADGLGAAARVHSPTFTLVNEYRGGNLPIYHLDLYRLENSEQIIAAGLDIFLPPQDGVAIVEWFDRLGPEIRLSDLRIIRFTSRSPDEREITYEDTRP